MKIALVTADLPYPLDSGSKIRNFKFLEQLSKIAEVELFTLARTDPKPEHIERVQQLCHRIFLVKNERGVVRKITDVFRSFFFGVPYLILANTDKRLKRRLAEILPEVDLLQLDELCVLGNSDIRVCPCPVVLDAHNAEAVVQQRLSELPQGFFEKMFHRVQASRTASYERKMARKVGAIFCVSKEDHRYFSALNKKSIYAPNGVSIAELESAPREQTVLFTGTLQYLPNRDGLEWFLERIWPSVLRRNPGACLQVIARNPPAELVAHNPQVKFMSGVDHIEPYLSAARVMVVPIRAGGGTRFKILQAFAHGLPVVSTTLGAEGIDVKDGKELLIADEEVCFAEQIVSLLKDDAQCRELADSARALIDREYLWEKIFADCRAIYSELRE